MNNKYLLLLLFSFLSLSGFSQQGPAVPFVRALPGGAMCNPGDCTTLSAMYFNTGATTDYDVNSIPFNPVFAFSGQDSNPVDANQDDYWSSAIHLQTQRPNTPPVEMSFCFYGQKYNYLMINANGAVTFSVAGIVPGGQYVPGAPVGWNLTGTPIPTA